LLSNKHKYLLSLLVIVTVPGLSYAQNTNVIHNKSSQPDTSEYEIIYQVDTIHQTKTIIEHDTIIQSDTSAKKADTANIVKLLSRVDNYDTIKIKNDKHVYLDFLLSPFIYSNNYKGNDASANTLIDYRRSNEKPQLSFSFSLTPEYKINRWSIQSGLQYSLLRNKYIYPYQVEKSTVYKQDSSYSAYQPYIVDIYYQVNGPDTTMDTVWGHHWVTVHDTLTKTKKETVSQVKNGIQYCSFIEVPLIFGFEFFNYKKLSLELKTGVITSFIVYRKGEIVTFNDGTQTFINLSAYPFVTTTFSGYLGLNINYEISKNINIEVLPYYQEGYSSLLKKESSISQIIDKKGISIGLKYKF
jgi:hypothetical protein